MPVLVFGRPSIYAPVPPVTPPTVPIDVLKGDYLRVVPGLRLLDYNDNFIEDITDSMVSFKLTYSLYASNQMSAQLKLGREFQWGVQRVQPYVTIYDESDTSYSWDMGIFFLGTPNRVISKFPETWEVEAYGKLDLLDTPVGKTYYLPAGTKYLTAVKNILQTELGETKINFDGTKNNSAMQKSRTWPLDDGSTTWLIVVNDLLKAINYTGIWCDRQGWYRAQPYIMPLDRADTWTYNANDPKTIVGPERTVIHDFYRAPNRWIFYIQDPQTELPVAGNGYYEVVNWVDGPTSIASRGGRVITRVTGMDAASHSELVARGDNIVENDKTVDTKLEMYTGINPEHWHLDVVSYVDAALGATRRYSVEQWELDLFGSMMKQTWRAL